MKISKIKFERVEIERIRPLTFAIFTPIRKKKDAGIIENGYVFSLWCDLSEARGLRL